MPWGKQDDAFDEDKRVMRLLVEEGEAGVTAMGLWQLCFTWANRNTRRRGKRPGLLPPMLPMIKMGPRGLVFAALLAKHELWEPAGVDGADGWVIVDFANTLPTEDVSTKRAEAGRRGAQKRWAAKRAADAAAAAAGGGSSPSSDGKLPQPDGIEPHGDGIGGVPAGSNRVLPDGYIGLPSVCHAATSENDGNEPSADGTLLSDDAPNRAVDNPEYGTLLSIDGTLPLGGGSLPPSGSKTAPQSLSQSPSPHTKDSPTGVGGVLAWPGSSTQNGKGRHRDEYTPEFLAFWEMWGKRGQKRDAARAWHAALDRAPVETIMAAVPAWVESTPNTQYRPYAERWLSGDAWESAVPAPQRAVSGGAAVGPYRNPPESAFRHTRI